MAQPQDLQQGEHLIPAYTRASEAPVSESLEHRQSPNIHDSGTFFLSEETCSGSAITFFGSGDSPGIHELPGMPAATSSRCDMPLHLSNLAFPDIDGLATGTEHTQLHGSIVSTDNSNHLHTNALCCAADRGSYEMIQCLLQAGANPTTKDISGRTALHYAARHSNTTILKRLLEPEVDIDVQNSQGRTPLFTAIVNGNIDAVRLLLQSGASVYVKDIFGCTVLCLAVNSGSLELVEILIEFGADVNG